MKGLFIDSQLFPALQCSHQHSVETLLEEVRWHDFSFNIHHSYNQFRSNKHGLNKKGGVHLKDLYISLVHFLIQLKFFQSRLFLLFFLIQVNFFLIHDNFFIQANFWGIQVNFFCFLIQVKSFLFFDPHNF